MRSISKYIVDALSNGPGRKQVMSRTTYDMHFGKTIDHLVFDENTNSEELHKNFPKGISWIKIVLLNISN